MKWGVNKVQRSGARLWSQLSVGLEPGFATVVGSWASFSASKICFLIGKLGSLEHISQGAQEV